MSTDEFVGLVIPAHIVDYATQQEKAKRLAEGKDPDHAVNPSKLATAYVETLLAGFVPERGLEAPRSGQAPAVIDSVEQAAEIIVNTLEPEHRNKIHQVAKETNHPLAAYVVSPMLLVNDSGSFSSLLGKWADAVPQSSKAPITTVHTGKCEYCGQPIANPARVDQRFCNMPEDGAVSCGSKWNKDNVMPTRDTRDLERAYGPQRQLSL